MPSKFLIYNLSIKLKELNKKNYIGKISLNFPFRSCKCIQINDYYYISGGFTPGEIETNQCFRIKLEKNEFVVERLPSMIENRANHSLVYIKNINYLIAIGSFNKINCEYLNLNEINNNNNK